MLKALEDAGRIRRGYFVGGVGATQFALPAALELLRSLREPPDDAEVVVSPPPIRQSVRHDPEVAVANPRRARGPRGPTRTVGALVVLVNGALAAYISRGARQVQVFLPEDEPARSTTGRALSRRGSPRSRARRRHC